MTQLSAKLVAKFVPGVNAVVQIYDGLSWFLNNQDQLGALAGSFITALNQLAASNQVDRFATTVVNAIERQALPAVLNFAVAQLGLGDLRQQVQRVVSFIPNRVDAAMRAIVARLAARVGLGNNSNAQGSQAPGQPLVAPATFTYNSTAGYQLRVQQAGTAAKGVRDRAVPGAGTADRRLHHPGGTRRLRQAADGGGQTCWRRSGICGRRRSCRGRCRRCSTR